MADDDSPDPKSNTESVDEAEGQATIDAEGGTLSTFPVTANAMSGTIQVTMHYIVDNGEPRRSASRSDTADAVPTEDGQGTVTPGIGGRVEGTWTADDIQETPSGPFHALVLR